MVFGDLFLQLKPRFWYFEVVNLFRQLALNGILTLFNTSVALYLYLSISILLLFASLIMVLRPYVATKQNRAQYLCALALVMMMASQLAMLPRSGGDADAQVRKLEGQILVTVTCLMYVAVALYMGESTFETLVEARERALQALHDHILFYSLQVLEQSASAYLSRYGLEWEEVQSVFKAQFDGVKDMRSLRKSVEVALSNPEKALLDVACTSRALCIKIILSRLALHLAPWLERHDLEREEVMLLSKQVLEGIETTPELQEKVSMSLADPEALLVSLGDLKRPILVQQLLIQFKQCTPEILDWNVYRLKVEEELNGMDLAALEEFTLRAKRKGNQCLASFLPMCEGLTKPTDVCQHVI